MDKLASLPTDIRESSPGTYGAYEPLLVANRSTIWATPRKTFSYGPNHRQTLDVYEPSEGADGSNPVFIFFHGGGFYRGAKNLEDYASDTVYANLGHFFAQKHGFTVVVANYRLYRHEARFPSGGEDFALTIRWAIENLAKDKKRDLHIAGNSAGGSHMACFILHPDFADTRAAVTADNDKSSEKGLALKSAAWYSTPFDFKEPLPQEYRRAVLAAYFKDDIEGLNSLSLLRDATASKKEILPGAKLLVLVVELDPEDEIVTGSRLFHKGMSDVRQCDWIRVEGHNHLSLPLGLGTDIEREEKWGHQVAAWMKSA